jgi:hypothetical protein
LIAKRGNTFWPEPEDVSSAFRVLCDETGLLQHLQVLRDGWPAYGQPIRQFPDSAWSIRE